MGPLRGASLVGQPILTEELGPDARIAVEVAWGADPDGNAELWSWTDITGDVYQDPGISFRYGRRDEAGSTQPANGSMTLNNDSGNYSLGGESINWPNVVKNVPLRIRVDPNGSGFLVAFQGNVVSFKPSWDRSITGDIAIVQVEISGILRRMGQGTAVQQSPIKRAVLAAPDTVMAYWPCEVNEFAKSFDAPLGGVPMTWTGQPDLASNTDFVGSGPLPTLKGSIWTGVVQAYTSTATTTVRFMAEFPTANEINDTTIMRLVTTGGCHTFFLVYRTASGGSLNMFVYDRNNVLITSSGDVDFNLHSAPRNRRYSIELTEVAGPSVQCRFACVDAVENGGGGYFDMAPMVGYDVNEIVTVDVNPSGQLQDVAIGHITVQNVIPDSIFSDFYALTGNAGDSATARFRRLCDENSLKYQQWPSPPEMIQQYTLMGPQRYNDLASLLRECEVADQGIIFDGVTDGLTHVTRDYRENQSAALTIDVGAQELAPGFQPTDDDQRTVNRATVTRASGAKGQYEDTDGPLGTDTIGVYDADVTVNLYQDGQTTDFASWLVHLGTVEGYRYPSINLNIRAVPRLAALVLTLRPGSRIDLVNVRTALPAHPAGTVSLVVEGVQMKITPFEWTVQLTCSPFDPWRIIVLADAAGDTGENVIHLDTSGSRLTASADAGATSLTVETYTGPVWTQDADDFPFDLAVGGIKATVTAVSGTTSPQTFTIQPLTVARLSGAPVEVWSQPVLELARPI